MLRKQNKLLVNDLNKLKTKAFRAYEAAVERANPFTAVQFCVKKMAFQNQKKAEKH